MREARSAGEYSNPATAPALRPITPRWRGPMRSWSSEWQPAQRALLGDAKKERRTGLVERLEGLGRPLPPGRGGEQEPLDVGVGPHPS